MNDFEYEIYDVAVRSLEASFPGITCSADDLTGEPALPAVQIVLIDQTPDTKTAVSGDHEVFTWHQFEAQAYSSTGYMECKAILKNVDSTLSRMGFTRQMMQRVANAADGSTFRMVARWRARSNARGEASA